MIIAGEKFTFDGTFETPITVADSWVMPKNKLGDGNGEAKLYVGSRDKMEAFFGEIGFTATCFVLRQDLQAYMNAIKAEYLTPSQDYRGKYEMRSLWSERMEKINALPDGIVDFTIREQSQIAGPRGYVNSSDKIYKLIREISLPLVSYISAMRLDYNGQPIEASFNASYNKDILGAIDEERVRFNFNMPITNTMITPVVTENSVKDINDKFIVSKILM